MCWKNVIQRPPPPLVGREIQIMQLPALYLHEHGTPRCNGMELKRTWPNCEDRASRPFVARVTTHFHRHQIRAYFLHRCGTDRARSIHLRRKVMRFATEDAQWSHQTRAHGKYIVWSRALLHSKHFLSSVAINSSSTCHEHKRNGEIRDFHQHLGALQQCRICSTLGHDDLKRPTTIRMLEHANLQQADGWYTKNSRDECTATQRTV